MEDRRPPSTEENLVPAPLRRFIPIIGAVGIGLALFGFISGILEPRAIEVTSDEHPADESPLASSLLPAAPTYTEMASGVARRSHEQESLTTLRFEIPGIFDTVQRTDDMKLAALADRARNRAYDGAPPTVPHSVDALSVASCLACHGEGIRVGDRVASRVSHPHYSNCTQCHVAEQRATGLPTPDSVASDFIGLYRAGPGVRASPGAPPAIPHRTWMREDCMSCHGLLTRAGTRTTHPWLTNCQQCHAASAERDQVDFFTAVP